MYNKPINIAYVGSSYKTANLLYFNCEFNLKAIICERLRLTKEIILFSEINNIKLINVNNKQHFEENINKLKPIVNNYIIFNFGIIIPEILLKNNRFFNIHPGSLLANRGRNPIERALIDNHKEIEVSIYEITEKIDLGDLIDSTKIYIDVLDDNLSLSHKVDEVIPSLLNSLYLYMINMKSSISIKQGIYYKPIKEEDITIDLYTNSIVDIYNKIRSQKKYNGAILKLNERKYYIKNLKNLYINDHIIKSVVHEIKNSVIIVKKDKYIMELEYEDNN